MHWEECGKSYMISGAWCDTIFTDVSKLNQVMAIILKNMAFNSVINAFATWNVKEGTYVRETSNSWITEDNIKLTQKI